MAQKKAKKTGKPAKAPIRATKSKSRAPSKAPPRASAPSKPTPGPSRPPAAPSKPAPAPSKPAPPPAPSKPPPAPAVAAPPVAVPAAALTGSAAIADRILREGPASRIAELGADMLDARANVSVDAVRVLTEILARKPEALSPLVDRFVEAALDGTQRRPAELAAEALPVLARIAPARVARHLDTLRESFDRASEIGKDGLVRTFSALCAASVAYQKRLEPALSAALAGADPKTLARWTEVALPALKGEPHAAARAVVEARLYDIPRPFAQQIAAFLGIKLRPARPGT
jgi:hypothetical protein